MSQGESHATELGQLRLHAPTSPSSVLPLSCSFPPCLHPLLYLLLGILQQRQEEDLLEVGGAKQFLGPLRQRQQQLCSKTVRQPRLGSFHTRAGVKPAALAGVGGAPWAGPDVIRWWAPTHKADAIRWWARSGPWPVFCLPLC